MFYENIDEQFAGSRFATKWHLKYEVCHPLSKVVGNKTGLDEFESAKINEVHQPVRDDFKQSSDELAVLEQPSGPSVWNVAFAIVPQIFKQTLNHVSS